MKKQRSILAIMLVVAAAWMGCASTNEAGNRVIKNNRFEHMMKKPDAVVLDVRTPEEYKEGHLKNAQLLDYNSGAFDSSYQKLDKNKTYLVYCKSGKRSDKAASKMKEAGFDKVAQLKDGYQGWKGATEKN